MSTDDSNIIPIQSDDEVTPEALKKPKRADAIANRQLILETAAQLFAEQGVGEVKMANIAEAAGVGQGTLYRAFSNKGALCLALMDEDLRDFQEHTLQIFRETGDQPVLTQLAHFLDRLIAFLDKHTALMCEAQGYQILSDEINHTALHSWFHRTISVMLRRAQANGEVRAEADVIYLADAILAPLNPNLFQYQRDTLGFDLDVISRELRTLVLRGIRAD